MQGMKRINLHNHTTFSDGTATPEELVKAAINANIAVLAITDHYEYFWKIRMEPKNIRRYIDVLSHMKKKYADNILLKSGLEVDCRRADEKDFPYDQVSTLDLVLFERVYTMDDLRKLLRMRERLRTKVGLAHPTFDGFHDPEELIKLLETHKIFIELNTAVYDYDGIDDPPRKYCPLFFETQEDFFKMLKGKHIEISVGSDSHNLEMVDDLERAYKFIEKLGLEGNMIDI
jgi:histidinol phosphatase-like PHP family hydrolase